jgi:hypothetical protein
VAVVGECSPQPGKKKLTRRNTEPERKKKYVASTALRRKRNSDTPLHLKAGIEE